MTHIETLKASRRVSVPIISWNTADPAMTVSAIVKALPETAPVMLWDLVQGVRPANSAAQDKTPGDTGVGNPVEILALAAAGEIPERTCLIMANMHLQINNPSVIQAVWNTRDSFKARHCTLILMAPSLRTPTEWANDVLVIDEPLPTVAELAEIVAEQMTFTEIPKDKVVEQVTAKALTGLSAFAAEQAVAMSMRLVGEGPVKERLWQLDASAVWQRKRKIIESTKGLSMWSGKESFADVRGLEQSREFGIRVVRGKTEPQAIIFIDEIEKAIPQGGQGDTSGTSQDQLGTLLQEMQDTDSEGILCLGHPGSGKSLFAKALGNTAGIPTIKLDLGEMKGSLVGQSEETIRAAMKIVKAVSGGRALYIATCNRVTALPPELRRRFTLGTFFFDLPTAAERVEIWKLYVERYNLSAADLIGSRVDDDGWTGSDIANCARRAWMFGCTIKEAAIYSTPLIKTSPKEILALQQQADGAYLSASSPGLYKLSNKGEARPKVTSRQYQKN